MDQPSGLHQLMPSASEIVAVALVVPSVTGRENKLIGAVLLCVVLRHIQGMLPNRDIPSASFGLRRADFVAAIERLNNVDTSVEERARGKRKVFLRSHTAVGSEINHRAVALPGGGNVETFG